MPVVFRIAIAALALIAAPCVATAADSGGTKVDSVASLAENLADRLASNPDDGEGWLLLAKSYWYMKRVDDALDAYSKAVALGESDPTFEAQLVGRWLGE
jgi:cytochrome c-type biogenesis protein CcmH